MFKKMAGSLLAATAVVAAAAALPATANATPATVGTGSEVVIRHASDGTATACTLGFVLTGTDNQDRGLIAGHCGDLHDDVTTSDGRTIGRIAAVEFPDTFNGPDTAVVSFLPGVTVDAAIEGVHPTVSALTKDDVNRNSPVLCKLGATTGLSCGPLATVATPGSMIAFHGKNLDGDSGGPVWTYGTNGEILAVGTVSGSPIGKSDIAYVEPIAPYLKLWQLR
ncbi:hypothetical protein CPI83_29660 (plasmid) [Rhodococcus sp. H-CA8f]|uniref:hypothetical protein n=1 Tax=Rhodococcus sp. H-CA8f TaxID=1727214 RepID=UPI000BE4100A|nr:hypothetical protein [Rhodococcus sp. H-CA8f]ATI36370.1 hypothetical protein CPI83_29660 [Rhodococcus sp. H-CA8f]